MVEVKRFAFGISLSLALIALTGCDVDVQPIGGGEGRTLVYAVVGRQGVPNGGIICSRNGCIVIDPALTPMLGATINSQALAKSKIYWDSYYAAKRERPATLQPPVLYVLNTTFRATHTFGNQSFDKADIISTPAAKERLVRDGPSMREELREQWKIPGLETHYTAAANITIEGTMNIETPEIKVQFMNMGDGVGEGDAVVYLPGSKVLFAGDLVAPNFVPYHKGRTQTVRNWIAILKKLEAMDIETVVPGHGDVGRKDAVTKQREFLEALVAAVQGAINSNLTADQAAQSVKLEAYTGWSKYAEWMGENVKLVYRELKGEPLPKTAAASSPGIAQPVTPVERVDAFRDK